MSKTRIYVGTLRPNAFLRTAPVPPSRTVFRSSVTPTKATHGDIYTYAIGPFKTMRGARYMALCGKDNPNCSNVNQAERLAEQRAALQI